MYTYPSLPGGIVLTFATEGGEIFTCTVFVLFGSAGYGEDVGGFLGFG